VEYKSHVAYIFFLIDTDDCQLWEQLITHIHYRLFEDVSLPSPQKQMMAIVNATADEPFK
jgi:hypothetical protein